MNLRKSTSSADSIDPPRKAAGERRAVLRKVGPEQADALPEVASVFSADRHIGTALRETYRAFARTLAQNLAPLGLTLSMWFALRSLWEADGLSQADLGRRIDLNPAAIVGVLNALQGAGLIERRRTQKDRRVYKIFLTAAGRRLRMKATAQALKGDVRATRGISQEEMDQVLKLLTKMRSNLSKR